MQLCVSIPHCLICLTAEGLLQRMNVLGHSGEGAAGALAPVWSGSDVPCPPYSVCTEVNYNNSRFCWLM